MEAERIQELKGLVEFCKLNPHILHTPSLAFFKNFLQISGARIPAFGGSSNDGDDHKDKKPFASRKRDAPMEDISNDDIAESGDNQEAAQLPKAKAMEAITEAASVLKDGEVILIHSGSELDEKLDAASKASRLSVLYFTATWCGPCRYVGPAFTSLAGKYPKVVFLKVDIDETREVAAEWDIRSIPTFIFVRNGEEVDELVTVDKNALEQKIAQHAS